MGLVLFPKMTPGLPWGLRIVMLRSVMFSNVPGGTSQLALLSVGLGKANRGITGMRARARTHTHTHTH